MPESADSGRREVGVKATCSLQRPARCHRHRLGPLGRGSPDVTTAVQVLTAGPATSRFVSVKTVPSLQGKQ